LARQLSQHDESRDDGGSLGWFTTGEAGSAFDEFVFNPEIELGTVSKPLNHSDTKYRTGLLTDKGY